MQNKNESRINTISEVLKTIIIFSKKVKKKRNVPSGWGITKADFDNVEKGHTVKIHNASSKQFHSNKERLLEKGWIRPLESKSIKEKYFSITPLGILHFLHITEKLDITTFDYIMTHLKYYYQMGKPKNEMSYIDTFYDTWSSITRTDTKNIESKELLEIFRSCCQIDVKENNVIAFYCMESKIAMINYKIEKNKNIIDYEYLYSLNAWYSTGKSSESEFYYDISKFLIQSFAYSIFKQMSRKLSSMKNINSPQYKKLYRQIEDLPYSIRGIAIEFAEALENAGNQTMYEIRGFTEYLHEYHDPEEELPGFTR